MLVTTYLKRAPKFGSFCKNIFLTYLIISIQLAPIIATAHPAARIHRGLNEASIECTVHIVGSLAKPGVKTHIPHRLSCSVENHGATVVLDGDHEKFFLDGVKSGVTMLSIPTDIISADLRVDLDELSSSKIVISDHKHTRGLRGAKSTRSLIADYEGTFKMLVVRVSDKQGHSPTYSARQLSNHIFNDEVNMANQYRACSNNKLRFKKANGGSDVVGGVVDIVVEMDLSSAYDSTVCVSVADDALSSYDVGAHDYTMYICPEAVEFGNAAGVADVNGSKSWFSDTFGSSPYVQMHEIGHNLFFYHSGEGKLEYGDPTGIMGGMYETDNNWGRMCFNAAKTFYAGWYSDHHVTVTPESETYNGNLVDLNSVNLGQISEEDEVVVRVQGTKEEAMFFMLHRLTGITSDMKYEYIPDYANRVNIIRQGFQSVSSKIVAQLASGEEYIQNNWARSGKALHIKVCSISRKPTDGGAKVIVYLDGENFASCDDNNNRPPPAVTSGPTKAPVTSLSCIDATTKMSFSDGTKKTCKWVAASNTEERCSTRGVASHCPATCGTCILCVDSSKKFQMPNEEIKSCAWVRNNPQVRCKKEGVASSCRATCGMCSS